MPNKDDKLGALWQKRKGNKDYFTGVVTIDGVTHQIVVFANSYKDTEKQPDWIVYKSQPRG